ncbi:DUF6088 family protein [Pontiellaceae bacterium B12227]|nr:DUF6088 family protein [Pontiellaceae bacterium B12227]
MQSIENKIINRIYGNGRGWTFSKKDFLDLADDGAIRLALMRLTDRGTIRRVLRGIYDYPRFSDLLQETMGPDFDQVAHALARKSGWRIQASGNTALNLLGISTQIPAQAFYLSDGPSKTYEIGKRTLHFKKAALKESGFKHSESELLVQALKELGRERADAALREKLQQAIPAGDWPKLVRDTKSASAWIHEIIREIAEEATA